MLSNSRKQKDDVTGFDADALDLRILELLAKDGSTEFTELAKQVGADKRTVAKRVSEMERQGVMRVSVEINWSTLGVEMMAFVGSQTELGEQAVERFYEFVRNEPRVIEAYTTVGSDEYFLTVLDENLQALREDVLRKLEPLTADLSTAIVSRQIKRKDYAAFLAFLQAQRGLSRTDKRRRSNTKARKSRTSSQTSSRSLLD